jgi:hypothetical protein
MVVLCAMQHKLGVCLFGLLRHAIPESVYVLVCYTDYASATVHMYEHHI